MQRYSVEELIKKQDVVIVDVRSESEYLDDAIPGAYNMPILNDTERAEIGYIYKQVDKELAKRKGLEIASPKLIQYYDFVLEKKQEGFKEVVFYCYRGGMRSQSVVNVLTTLGLKVGLLNGGYKDYRKYILEQTPKQIERLDFIALQGLTGIGKTKILGLLKDQGCGVLDLEKLACNSGSTFGNISHEGESTTQKRFETELYFELEKIKEPIVFLECESRRIGKVSQPEVLYNKLQIAPRVLLSTSMSNRVEIIKTDYITGTPENKEKIEKAIASLNKGIGNEKVSELIDKIEIGEYDEVIEFLMRNYYDPLYQHSIDKRNDYIETIYFEDYDEICQKLIELKNKALEAIHE